MTQDTIMERVTAAVLAGGLGTRLQATIPGRPKALAEICGRPFLDFLLDRIVAAGIGQAVLCTGHLAGMVLDRYGDAYGPLRLTHSAEPHPLGTGGALRLAAPLIRTPLAMVFNGDSAVDADLGAFADWFAASDAPAAILAVSVTDTSRFGGLKLGPEGLVTDFLEKRANAGPGLINAGIYLFRREIIDALGRGEIAGSGQSEIPPGFDQGGIPGSDTDEPLSLETQVFPALIGRGLAAFPVRGGFLDIGTPESYRQAEAFFAARSASPGPPDSPDS